MEVGFDMLCWIKHIIGVWYPKLENCEPCFHESERRIEVHLILFHAGRIFPQGSGRQRRRGRREQPGGHRGCVLPRGDRPAWARLVDAEPQDVDLADSPRQVSDKNNLIKSIGSVHCSCLLWFCTYARSQFS